MSQEPARPWQQSGRPQRNGRPQRQMQRAPRANQHSAETCSRCTGRHSPDTCRLRDAECHFCHKTGHIQRACRLKKRNVRRLEPLNRVLTSQPQRVGRIQTLTATQKKSKQNVGRVQDDCQPTTEPQRHEAVHRVPQQEERRRWNRQHARRGQRETRRTARTTTIKCHTDNVAGATTAQHSPDSMRERTSNNECSPCTRRDGRDEGYSWRRRTNGHFSRQNVI